MKIKRRKQAKHLLSMYRNFFGFREPYRILIDGTFCKMSVQHNVDIKDQLGKYLQSEIQCLTTRCILTELEMLGEVMFAAKIIAQRFKTQPCGHKKKPVSAQTCLKSLLGDDNAEKFFLATQDFELTKHAGTIPGVPLLYLHQNNTILDKLSDVTAQRVTDVSQGKAEPSPAQQNSIHTMKKEADLATDLKMRKKRKRPRGPNPLSCKKSKKPGTGHKNEPSDSGDKRRRRKRKAKGDEKTCLRGSILATEHGHS